MSLREHDGQEVTDDEYLAMYWLSSSLSDRAAYQMNLKEHEELSLSNETSDQIKLSLSDFEMVFQLDWTLYWDFLWKIEWPKTTILYTWCGTIWHSAGT